MSPLCNPAMAAGPPALDRVDQRPGGGGEARRGGDRGVDVGDLGAEGALGRVVTPEAVAISAEAALRESTVSPGGAGAWVTVISTPIRLPALLSTGAPSAPGSAVASMLIASWTDAPVAVSVVTVRPTELTVPTSTLRPPEAAG